MESSAYPILVHLLEAQAGGQMASAAVVRTVLHALWSEYEVTWLAPLPLTTSVSAPDATGVGNEGSPSPPIDERLKYGLESGLMLLIVALRYGVDAEFEGRVAANLTTYMSRLEQFLSDADGDVFGYLWDDLMCAVLLKVVGCLARIFEICGGSCKQFDVCVGTSCGEAMRAVVAWVTSVVTRSAADGEISGVYQKLVLLLAIALGADCHMLNGSSAQSADCFRQLFLQCANVLTDRQLQAVLFSSVLHNGGITGGSLYATDFDVLLCIIRRSLRAAVSEDVFFASVLQTVEKQLLRDVAPPPNATAADVGEWIQRLDLSGGNYKAVLRAQGVDGEVLWSDLTSEDFLEMGIHNEMDAKRISEILQMSRR